MNELRSESAAGDQGGRRKKHVKLWLVLGLALAILVLLIVPPLVSINRYQSRITQLVSTSLGRPVRLSSVELRMLPRPGFLITNLTVDEDPNYGAEPVLHANTVLAAIRFLPLWRGKLQISRISVDEASVNLVHTADGRWNLDSIFQSAASSGTGQPNSGQRVPLPYIEATNSRINVKNGAEKLPFSLLDTDASLWREDNGDWRVRLRAQPARTDVSLDLADTGVLRVEARLRQGPTLRQMPIHLDVDWRQAQLGQLSRLLLGSDEGWRGDLAGELHLDGTVETAQIKARLRASGVHRAEFAPVAPLDFDASCGLVYHSGERSVDHLLCDSPVGDGRVRLTGTVRGGNEPPQLTLEADRVPAQMGLDVLRTVRSNLDDSLQASGAVSGKMIYDPAAAVQAHAPVRRGVRVPGPPIEASSLTGTFYVEGLKLSGGGLANALQIPRMTLVPAPPLPGEPVSKPALATNVLLPAGGPAPLNVTARLALSGFQVGVHGTATLARMRELAHLAGIAEAAKLNQVVGQPAALDLSIQGAWLAAESSEGNPTSERMAGTVALHDVSWKSEFLANPLELKSATVHLEDGALRWDPVDFVYGPVKGSATLDLPPACQSPHPCVPHFTLSFASLDLSDLQSALLGARTSDTLLSSLLDRLKLASPPQWPEIEGTAQAASLVVGPFTLTNVVAALHTAANSAEISSLDGAALGGNLHAAVTMSSGEKPSYSLNVTFSHLNPAQVGQLAGMRWNGGQFDGSGQLKLNGFSNDELRESAKGDLHFIWTHGSVAGADIPPALGHFDSWTADATIAGGNLTLGPNQLQRGPRHTQVEAVAKLGEPARVTFSGQQENRASRR